MHRPEPGAEPGLAPRASGRKERLAASPPRARPGPRAMLLRETPPRRGLACELTGDVLVFSDGQLPSLRQLQL